MTAPLASLRIAVHASGVAAAYAARMLGGMGAEVVLIEPAGGTPLRREPPFLPKPGATSKPLPFRGGVGVGAVDRVLRVPDRPRPPTPSPEREGESALFAYLTHGASFQTCDLTNNNGQASLAALLSQSDIFIDDTPLASREALGLDEAAIAARHPDLIHVSVLPFGATGAKAQWKGEEINLQHASGEGYLLPNGLSVEQFPDRPPVKIHGHFAEMQGGIAAALGALAALRVREQIGGQFVDISCQDAMLAVGAFAIQRFGDGQVEHRVERSFRYGGVLPCADGFVELLTLEQRQWDGLVELLGRPAWALDPALADGLERSRRGPELNRHIRAWAAVRKVEDIVREGQKLSVPLAKYNTPAEVLRDPHEKLRGLFQPVDVPGAGVLDMLISPVQFDSMPAKIGTVPIYAAPRSLTERGAKIGTVPIYLRPLTGIRIADFTVHNAGPFCTNLLSQLGAEVIKIESAVRPDAFRKPHPVYGRMGPATFDQVASTKLSVRVNLKKPEGVALAKRLVAISDVAAESFRPGVLERLGLGYEVLREIKRDIVLLAVSSSGQYGPDKHFAGYAPLFGAWGGLSDLTGYADGPPVEMRHVMDHTVGMNAAVAVLAALHRRDVSGEGVLVDISAREVASSLCGEALLLAAAGGEPRRMGNDHPRMAPHGVYPCLGEDRWVSIAVASDEEWQALAAMIGANEGRFATAAGRLANRTELDWRINGWTSARNAEDVTASLQAAGIAAHVSWNTQDLIDDAHLRSRGALVEVQEPGGKARAAVKVPMRLSKGADIGIDRGTPALGEHEDYVYGELLGMARAERQALEEQEVIY